MVITNIIGYRFVTPYADVCKLLLLLGNSMNQQSSARQSGSEVHPEMSDIDLAQRQAPSATKSRQNENNNSFWPEFLSARDGKDVF